MESPKPFQSILVSRHQTAALAEALAQQSVVDVELLSAVLAQNPKFDPAKSHPVTLTFGKLKLEQQREARAAIEGLLREIRMFPEFDHKAALHGVGAAKKRAAAKKKAAAPKKSTPRSAARLRNPLRDAVSKFLTAAEDFDLQTTRVDTYLSNSASPAVAALAKNTKPAVVNQLKRLQRLFRVTQQPGEIMALLGEGLHSAHAIASIPQSSFIQQFAAKVGGNAQAKAIHSRATVMQASALNLFRQVHAALSDVTPRAIGPMAAEVSAALKALPSWETLFGSLSFCDCQECQSVLGAAAYFVDLLQFLKKSTPNDNGQTPLDILLTRRPDLPFIKLNCENTNTLLPYIDLVNEILEAYVANIDPKTAHSTGDATADELSLNPQNVIDQAYVTLSQAVYPFALPFDRPLEMSRAYLEFLGSSRYEVMNTFQLGGNPSDFTKGAPTGLALACESLRHLCRGACHPDGHRFVG